MTSALVLASLVCGIVATSWMALVARLAPNEKACESEVSSIDTTRRKCFPKPIVRKLSKPPLWMAIEEKSRNRRYRPRHNGRANLSQMFPSVVKGLIAGMKWKGEDIAEGRVQVAREKGARQPNFWMGGGRHRVCASFTLLVWRWLTWDGSWDRTERHLIELHRLKTHDRDVDRLSSRHTDAIDRQIDTR